MRNPSELIKAWRKLHIRSLRYSYEELLREYTRATGKAADEAFAIDVLQWIKQQDNIGQVS